MDATYNKIANSLFVFIVSNSKSLSIKEKIEYIDQEEYILTILYGDFKNKDSIIRRIDRILNIKKPNDIDLLEVEYTCKLSNIIFNKKEYDEYLFHFHFKSNKGNIIEDMFYLSKYYITFNFLYGIFLNDVSNEELKKKYYDNIYKDKLSRLIIFNNNSFSDDNYFDVYYNNYNNDKDTNYIIKNIVKKDIEYDYSYDIEYNKIYGLNLEGELGACITYTINKKLPLLEFTSFVFNTTNINESIKMIFNSKNINLRKEQYIIRLDDDMIIKSSNNLNTVKREESFILNMNDKVENDKYKNGIYILMFNIKY